MIRAKSWRMDRRIVTDTFHEGKRFARGPIVGRWLLLTGPWANDDPRRIIAIRRDNRIYRRFLWRLFVRAPHLDGEWS